ncbi:DUF1127 domain-containing protein [uncultured Hoeflea sp.]|uniref:DUF1127 domain-containing protein n=1 Tax=uncultured Hoeflea sp. TaxID=538666 RepID=UPI002608ED8B|nr:DUF1127 domain-containing protein [uncultured Hoeflea sp.]
MNARSITAALTPARTTAAGQTFVNILSAAALKARKLMRAVLNRRAAHQLREFSDRELADIGLTRDDIGVGLSMPLSTDPTLEYARRARLNTRFPNA